MIRDRLIKWLGGYTESEMQSMRSCVNFDRMNIEALRETVNELSALVPVSAVTPKKRGRPRKVKLAKREVFGNTITESTYTGDITVN